VPASVETVHINALRIERIRNDFVWPAVISDAVQNNDRTLLADWRRRPMPVEQASAVGRADVAVLVCKRLTQTLRVSGGMHLRRHFRRDLCWTCHLIHYDAGGGLLS